MADGTNYVGRTEHIVEGMFGDDGLPPCAVPDDCSVCCLLSHQRPGESRRQWVDRIAGRALQIDAQTAMTGGGRYG